MTINQTINKYKDLSFKDKAAYALAIAAFTVGWIITIAGFIVPPLGQIHSTVLWVETIEQHIRRYEDQRLEE